MDSGFYAAVNGARRIDLRMEILSNNLANVNTAGFKQDRLNFDSFLTATGPEQFPLPSDSFLGLRGPGDIPFPYMNPSSNAYRVTYPMATGSISDLEQGELQHSGNHLDVAIEGEGFFPVQTPDGIKYTRDGGFTTNQLGELVTHDGFQVLGDGGAPLQVGEAPLVIGHDGTIAGPTGVFGRLTRIGFPAESLTKAGENLFTADPAQQQDLTTAPGGFAQGYVEGSNVNGVMTMTGLIESQRLFSHYMEMIRALDGLDEKAVNDVGRLQG